MTKNASASTASPSSACPAEACATCCASAGAGLAVDGVVEVQYCSTQQSSRASQVQEKVPRMPCAQGLGRVKYAAYDYSPIQTA